MMEVNRRCESLSDQENDKIHNELESIIKTEPEKFEDEFDQHENSEVRNKFDYWPRLEIFDVMKPTMTLRRLSAATITRLTSDKPDSILNYSQTITEKQPEGRKLNRSTRKIRKTSKKPSQVEFFLKQFKCQDCVETFKFRYELQRHILKVHYEGEKFECDCGKLHRYKSSFYACRSSHKSSGFKCMECDRMFKSRGALLGHWKRVHFKSLGKLEIDSVVPLKNEGNFTCDVCGRVLQNRRGILRHLTYQHFNPRYICDLCPKTEKRIGDLRIHMNNAHLKVKPYSCNHCGYKTAFQTNLRSHKKTHREVKVPNPKVPCKICNKNFTKGSISMHIKIVHENKCQKCPKMFKSKSDLIEHSLTVHFEGKVFTCNECGFLRGVTKCFICILGRDKTKYPCEGCDQKFPSIYLLRRHCNEKHPKLSYKHQKKKKFKNDGL